MELKRDIYKKLLDWKKEIFIRFWNLGELVR
jgi:hypothetical protein